MVTGGRSGRSYRGHRRPRAGPIASFQAGRRRPGNRRVVEGELVSVGDQLSRPIPCGGRKAPSGDHPVSTAQPAPGDRFPDRRRRPRDRSGRRGHRTFRPTDRGRSRHQGSRSLRYDGERQRPPAADPEPGSATCMRRSTPTSSRDFSTHGASVLQELNEANFIAGDQPRSREQGRLRGHGSSAPTLNGATRSSGSSSADLRPTDSKPDPRLECSPTMVRQFLDTRRPARPGCASSLRGRPTCRAGRCRSGTSIAVAVRSGTVEPVPVDEVHNRRTDPRPPYACRWRSSSTTIQLAARPTGRAGSAPDLHGLSPLVAPKACGDRGQMVVSRKRAGPHRPVRPSLGGPGWPQRVRVYVKVICCVQLAVWCHRSRPPRDRCLMWWVKQHAKRTWLSLLGLIEKGQTGCGIRQVRNGRGHRSGERPGPSLAKATMGHHNVIATDLRCTTPGRIVWAIHGHGDGRSSGAGPGCRADWRRRADSATVAALAGMIAGTNEGGPGR